ncbi:arginine--tRNA ligase [Dokdonia sp. MED134]|uniref:arginine--tRNA ligase n=2 Tax=Dokdonia TaxID=326319 RepID=UPI000068E43D|nr:arginine--tRNA ligase [Dokdonia sp. MED134]
MSLQSTIETHVKAAVAEIYKAELPAVEFQATRKEFEGDITVVVFPMLRVVKGNPVQIGTQIGEYLVAQVEEITAFNVVKGFLNLVVADAFYMNAFAEIQATENFGKTPEAGKAVMVEYSSPNTNKPLHLGHVRNVLLGYSVSEIIKAAGSKVYKTQIINDRGIHICKSMLAWERYGNGETPESTGLKGDKLVGNYYVKFESVFQKEYTKWLTSDEGLSKFQELKETQLDKILKEVVSIESKDVKLNKHLAIEVSEEDLRKGFKKFFKNQYFGDYSEVGQAAKEMLRKWEAGDAETVALWKKMNQWVYDGFEVTYKNIGVDFDSYYYESNTYLLGKDNIEEGLKKGVFERDPDGSVWCDLTEDGLDRKIVLRADGTAVYMTQDIGTAIQRVKDHPDVGGMIYTVGNEQDYHFQVLFLILKKLGYDWAENLFHLSYGMVDLPSGKMKSREGTVVDADDLINEVAATAGEISEELGKLDGYTDEEKKALYKTIGLGALKYYILKVDPKKRILFDPKESVDFQGNTGPFIQYTYVRIQAILRKAKELNVPASVEGARDLHPKEKELIKLVQDYPATIQLAAAQKSPAIIANYTYDLVKEYNSFFQQVQILGTDNVADQSFRVALSKEVGQVIESAFGLLGIDVPERM